jgi:NhaP-type Na+/H+ or K+/H+ antiporter
MVGAIALGTGIGWVGGKILDKWRADELVDFTFSLALGIGGYIIADHYLVYGNESLPHIKKFQRVLENYFTNTGII